MAPAAKPAGRIALWGMMAAVTVTLSLLEGLLPPLPALPPGARVGLANIPVLLAGLLAGPLGALPLALLKALTALLSRGGMAALMSLSGGLLSALCVCGLFALPRRPLGLAGVSVAGAVCHDLGQLLCGRLIMGTPALWAYAPVMLLLALPAGVLTGTLLRLLLPAVRRFWPDLSSRKTLWKG